MKHHHVTKYACFEPKCTRKLVGVAVALYVGHWILHGLVFLISPVLGAVSLALF
jgi:hypothetical protein